MKLKYLSSIIVLTTGLFAISCEDDDYSIATGNIITEVTTGEPVSITAVSAVVQGTVKDLSLSSSSSYQVGVYYGTSSDPTVSGTAQTGTLADDGSLTTTLTGLVTGTTYYYATFVTLQKKVTTFGEIKSFVATNAIVTTLDATDISATKATFSVQLTGVDGVEDIETGVKLSSLVNDVENGKSYALGVVSGLFPGTTYYYATYAVVGGQTLYGDVKEFTTLDQSMEYVDLGLSVMWAKCNLGAESETEVGALLGYGDQTGLMTSDDENDYPSVDIANTDYDAVSASIGGQIPTTAHITELLANTTQEYVTVDGIEGVRFTAANGNSIFLPVTGYRNGETLTEDGNGYYWSGSINSINTSYAGTLSFTDGVAVSGNLQRYLGLAVRPVSANTTLVPDNSKLIVGDIENNGNMRIEIYNEYGDSQSDPSININAVQFNKNMYVNFKLTGITGNLKDDAAGSYIAGLQYADADWYPGYWSSLSEVGDYEALVTGDGTYTVWMEVSSTAEGVVVFCVDIAGLWNDLVDTSKVNAEVISIQFDI